MRLTSKVCACICLTSLAVIGIAIAFQNQPKSVAVQNVSDPIDPMVEQALKVEAGRIRAIAGTDPQCIAQVGNVADQEQKDQLIVDCFVDRLRQEAIARIAADSFRLQALEQINAKR